MSAYRNLVLAAPCACNITDDDVLDFEKRKPNTDDVMLNMVRSGLTMCQYCKRTARIFNDDQTLRAAFRSKPQPRPRSRIGSWLRQIFTAE